METICQACGYQRRPTDQAPDWECPSCGKAYVKTLQVSPSQLVIYPDAPSSEASSRLHGDDPHRTEPKKKVTSKQAMLIGAMSLFLLFGIPVLTDPSAASDIIFHGSFGSVALIGIGILAAMVVGKRISAGTDPNDRPSQFAFGAILFGLMLLAMFFGLTISSRNESRVDTKIQLDGARATADVVRVYNTGCGRSGSCDIRVEYAFTPSSGTNPIHGYAWIGARNSEPNVTYARAQKKVPIAYEVDHPEVSALNFNDDVFRIDHGARAHNAKSMLGKLFLGLYALVLAILGFTLWLRPSKSLT